MATHDGRAGGRRGALTALVAGLALPILGFAGRGNAAVLEPAEAISNEGYYQLTWSAEEPVRLIESTDPEFSAAITLYTGSDSGHVVSGKANGTWYYRLESADGQSVLSEAARITVSHHSLGQAFLFFSLGAIVFAATLGLILFARPEDDERR